MQRSPRCQRHCPKACSLIGLVRAVVLAAFMGQEPVLAGLVWRGSNQGKRRESEQERTELTEIKLSVSCASVCSATSCSTPRVVRAAVRGRPKYFVCSFSPAAVTDMLRRG